MVFKSNSSAIELHPKNFDVKYKRIIHKYLTDKKGMVLYMAPWCPHCVNFAPTYENIAKQLGASFPLFYLDCNKYKELSQKLNINGFPTIMYIDRHGIPYKKYDGARDENSIIDDICKEAYVCSRRF